ncbi:MAG: hypothetical protein OER82_02070 [Nitrosopumilus sp.]|nr:hypothetical protein [Nitrosopumilus sp.]
MDTKSFAMGIAVGFVIGIIVILILGVVLVAVDPIESIEDACFENTFTEQAYQECIKMLKGDS